MVLRGGLLSTSSCSGSHVSSFGRGLELLTCSQLLHPTACASLLQSLGASDCLPEQPKVWAITVYR